MRSSFSLSWLIDSNDQEWRIRKENAGIVDEDPESILWGLKQALKDRKLYMFVILQMSLITAQSFNNFFPSIVGTLGYDSTKTLLLTSPPYFFAFFVSLAVSFHASHKQERGYHIAVPMLFALLGNILVSYVESHRPLLFFILCADSRERPCLFPPPAAATSPCS